ncbi:MFS transporter [Pseudoroseicyclus aestuarii]|uniref:DHA1 family inner membrane transport protein n=1 Tax=Pseudoroseicyclus aestuarii TaxID=1795041 RepID=A0A318SWE7_9RHOB|nr:MFS transporter [Pseudoroseicyclus aestuarii]PYE84709.1 DHA1 family inner membrane transport protein [Pseudoroseicyclus aestuarii]
MTKTDSPAMPTGRSAAPAGTRIVLFALAMGGFTIGTTEFAAMALVPYFSEGLGITEASAAYVIAAYALGVVIGAPLIAVLAARLPRRRLLAALMLLYGAANLASGLAPNFASLVALRFLGGLPHGAYFGIATLLAAGMMAPGQRGRAISKIMMGLTVATIIGVPGANILGQTIGWRWCFAIAGALALATAAMIYAFAPRGTGTASDPLKELDALKNRQVILTLLFGAIGFGGMFAVYTYLASTLEQVTGVAPGIVPLYFSLFGVGMTLGTFVAGWATDLSLNGSTWGVLGGMTLLLAIYPAVTGSPLGMAVMALLIGGAGCLTIMLQTRLMMVAREAQTLAAALNHAALNVGNALGPWLTSLFLAAGYGLPVAGPVGAVLGVAGLALFALTLWDERRAG